MPAETAIGDRERGRAATTPTGIPWRGWKDVLWRLLRAFSRDRVTLIAAGATFYLLLALFPALAAFVSLFGFVADPVTITERIAFLSDVIPTSGFDLIMGQLESLASQTQEALSFGFIFGLLLALWSANNGIKTLFQAMNIAYGETEKRSFVKLHLMTFLFTLGAIALSISLLIGVGVVPAVLALVGLDRGTEGLISFLRWPALLVIVILGISLLYRFGPSRANAKWRWITLGSVLATLIWLVASILFSWYLTNFANYNATYGSLGAVIGFMMWTWISVVVLIMGAELDAEIEHQTAHDSTTGPPKPMGERGAVMADTLGESRNAEDGT